MAKETLGKAFAGFLILVLAANMILRGIGKISDLLFWLIIAACAALWFAIYHLPRKIKKK